MGSLLLGLGLLSLFWWCFLYYLQVYYRRDPQTTVDYSSLPCGLDHQQQLHRGAASDGAAAVGGEGKVARAVAVGECFPAGARAMI